MTFQHCFLPFWVVAEDFQLGTVAATAGLAYTVCCCGGRVSSRVVVGAFDQQP